MHPPEATIAFVPREQFGTTQRSLETLYERTPPPFELVCIDGGSPPETQTYLERAAREKQFTLLRTETFLTPNQARNLALPYVHSPYVVFVDNDVLVGNNWLDPLVRCAAETGAWVVGPLYFEFEPEGRRLHLFGGECRIETKPTGEREYVEIHHHPHRLHSEITERFTRRETELIEFHTVLVAMEAFRLLGRLDEGLLCNAEHGDLCLSVRAAGQRVFIEPESQITYAPPSQLTGADREYFLLRWSEAWNEATNRRLTAKWGLTPNSRGLKNAGKWVAQHRRYALASMGALRKAIGRKAASFIEKRFIAPWERWSSWRRHPAAQFGFVQPAEARVVYAPNARATGNHGPGDHQFVRAA